MPPKTILAVLDTVEGSAHIPEGAPNSSSVDDNDVLSPRTLGGVAPVSPRPGSKFRSQEQRRAAEAIPLSAERSDHMAAACQRVGIASTRHRVLQRMHRVPPPRSANAGGTSGAAVGAGGAGGGGRRSGSTSMEPEARGAGAAPAYAFAGAPMRSSSDGWRPQGVLLVRPPLARCATPCPRSE